MKPIIVFAALVSAAVIQPIGLARADTPMARVQTVQLTISVRGDGRVTFNRHYCAAEKTCTFHVPKGEPITLEAKPVGGPNAVFMVWQGACDGKKNPVCTFTPTKDVLIQANFGANQLLPVAAPG